MIPIPDKRMKLLTVRFRWVSGAQSGSAVRSIGDLRETEASHARLPHILGGESA
jgi:hypothetical protein